MTAQLPEQKAEYEEARERIEDTTQNASNFMKAAFVFGVALSIVSTAALVFTYFS